MLTQDSFQYFQIPAKVNLLSDFLQRILLMDRMNVTLAVLLSLLNLPKNQYPDVSHLQEYLSEISTGYVSLLHTLKLFLHIVAFNLQVLQ
jgi:hypothetical protein